MKLKKQTFFEHGNVLRIIYRMFLERGLMISRRHQLQAQESIIQGDIIKS
jgi:hypothetical protein